MSLEHDKRKYPRLSITEAGYAVRFKAGGREIRNARLANLSAGGCGLEVQMAEAKHLEVGDVLEAFLLDHPDLPWAPLSAVVLRMLGKVPGKTSGYVLMGLEFQGVTPFVRDLIADHVATRLARP